MSRLWLIEVDLTLEKALQRGFPAAAVSTDSSHPDRAHGRCLWGYMEPESPIAVVQGRFVWSDPGVGRIFALVRARIESNHTDAAIHVADSKDDFKERRALMLSGDEKKYVERFIHDVEKRSSFLMNSWVFWVLLLLGWILVLYTFGIIRSNITQTTLRYVFLPGVGFGLVMMAVSGLGMKMVQRIRKEKRLIEIVKKLI